MAASRKGASMASMVIVVGLLAGWGPRPLPVQGILAAALHKWPLLPRWGCLTALWPSRHGVIAPAVSDRP